jgi:hypothetical protein
VTTTPPPSPSTPATTETKDPVAVTAPFREWGAILLVVATGVFLLIGLIDLATGITSSAGNGFAFRADAAFSDFVGLITVFFPLVGVLLATHVKPAAGRAKLVTLLALIDYGVAGLLGLVCLLVGLVNRLTSDSQLASGFLNLVVRLVWLALLGFAAFVVLRVYLGAYVVPKPKPAPGVYGYPAYPGYPQQQGYPQQPGYPQQQGYPQPGYPQQQQYPQPQQQQYPQQQQQYPQPGYAQYPSGAYPVQQPTQVQPQPQPQPPAQPQPGPAAAVSNPYPAYSVAPPNSAPPVEPAAPAPPAYPTSVQPAWTAPADAPSPPAPPTAAAYAAQSGYGAQRAYPAPPAPTGYPAAPAPVSGQPNVDQPTSPFDVATEKQAPPAPAQPPAPAAPTPPPTPSAPPTPVSELPTDTELPTEQASGEAPTEQSSAPPSPADEGGDRTQVLPPPGIPPRPQPGDEPTQRWG